MVAKKLNCKEEIINIVIKPEIKQDIRAIAKLEGRSMTSEINRILQKYAEEYFAKNNINKATLKTTETSQRSCSVF